jgi:hypothetical protein
MTENTAIVRSNNAIIPLRNMDDVERAAKAMAASGFFQDTKQLSQAIVKILAGMELGFGAFASMTGVHIIQNKPTLAANLMAAAVKRTGKYNYRITEHTDEKCELSFYESGQEVGKSIFTMEDANRAGLLSNPSWKKYPRNMLFARALSNGQKWYAPDIFGGATVYTPEELGADVDIEGNIIDVPTWNEDIAKAGQAKPPIHQAAEEPRDTRVWSKVQKDALINSGQAKNDFAAKGMLGLSNLPIESTALEIQAWGAVYRANRLDKNGKEKMSATEAAKIANEQAAPA